MSEPILVSRLVLPRHESEVAPQRFGVAEAVRVVDKRSGCLCGTDADAWNAPQQQHCWRLPSPPVQFLFDASKLTIERLDLFQEKVAA